MMLEAERRATAAEAKIAGAALSSEQIGFSYLASPYSHPDGSIRLQRYVGVMDAAAWLAQQRLVVYSPIAHWHPIATRHSLGLDAKSWEHINSTMITSATSLTMLLIPGWSESEGMSMELRFARARAMPVYWLKPTPRGFDWLVRAPAPAPPTPFDEVLLTGATAKGNP